MDSCLNSQKMTFSIQSPVSFLWRNDSCIFKPHLERKCHTNFSSTLMCKRALRKEGESWTCPNEQNWKIFASPGTVHCAGSEWHDSVRKRLHTAAFKCLYYQMNLYSYHVNLGELKMKGKRVLYDRFFHLASYCRVSLCVDIFCALVMHILCCVPDKCNCIT